MDGASELHDVLEFLIKEVNADVTAEYIVHEFHAEKKARAPNKTLLKMLEALCFKRPHYKDVLEEVSEALETTKPMHALLLFATRICNAATLPSHPQHRACGDVGAMETLSSNIGIGLSLTTPYGSSPKKPAAYSSSSSSSRGKVTTTTGLESSTLTAQPFKATAATTTAATAALAAAAKAKTYTAASATSTPISTHIDKVSSITDNAILKERISSRSDLSAIKERVLSSVSNTITGIDSYSYGPNREIGTIPKKSTAITANTANSKATANANATTTSTTTATTTISDYSTECFPTGLPEFGRTNNLWDFYTVNGTSAILCPVIRGLPIESQHRELVKEMIYCLSGVRGTCITPQKIQNIDGTSYLKLLITSQMDKSLKEVCEQILPLATYYVGVKKFITEIQGKGQVPSALSAALTNVLDDYYMILAQLENELNNNRLTLHKMFYYIRPTMILMEQIMNLVNDINTATQRSADILTNCYNCYKKLEGDKVSQEVIAKLLQKAAVPYMRMLQLWIHKGIIIDNYNEFLVVDGERNKDKDQVKHYSAAYWEKRYYVKVNRIPSFLIKYTDKILRTGKYINVIRECGKRMIVTDDMRLDFDVNGDSYVTIINEAYYLAARTLLNVLINENDLMGHLHSVKRYLLLYQGDFIVQFMDACEDELMKNVDDVLPSTLENLLGLTLRLSSARHDPYKDDLHCELLTYDLVTQMSIIINSQEDHGVSEGEEFDDKELRVIASVREILESSSSETLVGKSLYHDIISELSTRSLTTAAGEATKSSSKSSIQKTTDNSTDKPTDEPTDEPTDKPTDEEISTDLQTYYISDKPIEEPTDMSSATAITTTDSGGRFLSKSSKSKIKFNRLNLTGLECFAFRYNVKWPISLVLNQIAISKYQMLFRQLFFCKHVERQLCRIWKENGITRQSTPIEAEQYRAAFTLRQRMMNFVQNIEYYMMIEIIEPNWHLFIEKMKAVENVDNVLSLHHDFLDACLRNCMLLTESNSLNNVIFSLCKLCLRYCEFIQSTQRHCHDAELQSMSSDSFGESKYYEFELGSFQSDYSMKTATTMFEERVSQYNYEFTATLALFLQQVEILAKDNSTDPYLNLVHRINFNSFYKNDINTNGITTATATTTSSSSTTTIATQLSNTRLASKTSRSNKTSLT